MYLHPEVSRLIAAQRIQDKRARAEAGRMAAMARSPRSAARAWAVRLPWLRRSPIARRGAAGYPVP
jgi:hypothetical protein